MGPYHLKLFKMISFELNFIRSKNGDGKSLHPGVIYARFYGICKQKMQQKILKIM